jgi:hypothetical protein
MYSRCEAEYNACVMYVELPGSPLHSALDSVSTSQSPLWESPAPGRGSRDTEKLTSGAKRENERVTQSS